MFATTIKICDKFQDIGFSRSVYSITKLNLTVYVNGMLIEKNILEEVKDVFKLKKMPRNIVTMIKNTIPSELDVYLSENTFHIQIRSYTQWRKRFDARRDYVFNHSRKKS